MVLEFDSSISIVSIIVFFIFSVSFLFNVGVLTQIYGSAFLEEYDDKKTIIKNAREKLFDFRVDALKKIICLIPYFVSIVFCYSLTPILIELIKKIIPEALPTEYRVDIFIFLILYEIFLIGEAFWGINEKFIVRKGYRIYYNRPFFRRMLIVTLYIGSCIVESEVSLEQKKLIMGFFHIYNIDAFCIIYIFSIVVLLNNNFVIKWISRYIVLIDHEICINKEKENNANYSFYGMANLLLSLAMMLFSVFLIIKYTIWKETVFFVVLWALFITMPLSVLAGQRDYFVSITRRKYIKKQKMYYLDVNNNKRLINYEN